MSTPPTLLIEYGTLYLYTSYDVFPHTDAPIGSHVDTAP